MCLALVALDAHPRYSLVIAANRDEYYARSTAPAQWWDAGVLAGRDGIAGGTWLGLDRRGRWSLVTNFREAGRTNPAAPSRGALVRDAIESREAPLAAAARAVAHGAGHNGFNLLVGAVAEAACGSNRASGATRLDPGIHAVSNHLLDTPWPKLERSRRAFAEALTGPLDDPARLLDVLRDRTPAEDGELPATGMPLETERLLSSPFIVSESYGTRSSTVIAITLTGNALFVERSYDRNGDASADAMFIFDVEA